eukprot:g1062.t1
MATLAEEQDKLAESEKETAQLGQNSLQGDYKAKRVSVNTQTLVLKKLAENLKDLRPRYRTDRWLKRWAGAREWDVEKATEMALTSHKWRNESGAETILQDWEVSKPLSDWFPGGMDKFSRDPEGDIFSWERLGAVDVHGILRYAGDDEIIQRTIHSNEEEEGILDDLSEEMGRPAKIVVIQDLKGLSLGHLIGISIFGKIIGVSSANYPERVKKVFIVRAPGIFMMVWGLVKHIFDARQRAKFFFLGSNYLDTLTKNGVPLDKIPGYLEGGWKEHSVVLGGKIPDDAWKGYGYTELVLSAGKKSETFEVKCPKGHLVWIRMFEASERDCGIEVLKDGKEVLAEKEWRSHTWYVCDDAEATFSVTFDNSYSWFKSKTVRYKFETKPYKKSEEPKQDE